MEKQFNNYTENPKIPGRAKAIKAARLIKGLSRKEAAQRLGWTHQSIERIENGRWSLSNEKLTQMLKAYLTTKPEFSKLERDPHFAMQRALEKQSIKDGRNTNRPRRNFYKKLTNIFHR